MPSGKDFLTLEDEIEHIKERVSTLEYEVEKLNPRKKDALEKNTEKLLKMLDECREYEKKRGYHIISYVDPFWF